MEKTQALSLLVTAAMPLLGDDLLKDLADKLLDAIETKIKETSNPVDDIILTPICAKVREAFGIPD